MSDRTINTNSYNEFGQVIAKNFVQGDFINVNGNFVQGDSITVDESSINVDLSQDFTQIAPHIEMLIENLQKQGQTIDLAQSQVANNIASQVKANPTLQEKLIKWGQSLGDATVSDVAKGVVKLAIRSAGLPLP